MFASGDGTPWRRFLGDCRIGEGGAKWRARRSSLCSTGAAQPFRSHACACGQTHGVGLLSCAEWIHRKYAGEARGSDRAFRSGLLRLRAGEVCFFSGGCGEHGCKSGRRRCGRRSPGPASISVSTHVAALRNLGAQYLYLLGIHAAGRRRAWNVRVSCGEDGVVAAEIIECHYSLARTDSRPLDAADGAVGFALDCGRVESDELTPPPQTLRAFFGHCGEPVLPDHGPHFARRLTGKRIALKEIENVLVVGKKRYFSSRNDGIVLPRA